MSTMGITFSSTVDNGFYLNKTNYLNFNFLKSNRYDF